MRKRKRSDLLSGFIALGALASINWTSGDGNEPGGGTATSSDAPKDEAATTTADTPAQDGQANTSPTAPTLDILEQDTLTGDTADPGATDCMSDGDDNDLAGDSHGEPGSMPLDGDDADDKEIGGIVEGGSD